MKLVNTRSSTKASLKNTRQVALCLSAFLGIGSTWAFSSTGRSVLTTRSASTLLVTTTSRTSNYQASKQVSQRYFPQVLKNDSNVFSKRQLGPQLHMSWLQNFFGGGAYNMKIDYSTLDFPGPELGQLAIEGTAAPTHSPSQPHLEIATFAGGCFWGLELAYQRVPGVAYTAVGYTAGAETYPTYDQVCAGNTGHTEAVCVYFDPKECSYETLLDTFFERVDPTTRNGQGRDFGRQYRTGVYYHGDEQEKKARERFQQEQKKYKRPIASECQSVTPFWPAEQYHQQYLAKGGRFGLPQSPEKGCKEEIRCYG